MSKKSPLAQAIQQIADEKGIDKKSIIETIEAALAAAYRKDFGKKNQNIVVEFDSETGASKIFDVKTVVDKPIKEKKPKEEADSARTDIKDAGYKKERKEGEKAIKDKKENKDKEKEGEKSASASKDVEAATDKKDGGEGEEEIEYLNEKTELTLEQAKEIKKNAKLGDVIKTELKPPADYGRMAAQTAKQVIIQRLREIEREITFAEYRAKEGEILNGIVQRFEGRTMLIDLGQATAIMPVQEQVANEHYSPGQRIRVYLLSVEKGRKGPELLVSRSHPNMVKKLFTLEVPEIASEVVKIKSIAREAGSRTKVAVHTEDENIDPIGSCVGQRGTRVQTIIGELGGEKIDIIEWSDKAIKFISNALSPAKVVSVTLREKEKGAVAEVKEDQLSLAIGKAGQNVRLASDLTGWRIDIVGEGDKKKAKKVESEKESKPKKADDEDRDKEKKQEDKVKTKKKEEKEKVEKKDNKKEEKREKSAKDETNTIKPAPTPTPKESPTEKESPMEKEPPAGEKEKAEAEESKKEKAEKAGKSKQLKIKK